MINPFAIIKLIVSMAKFAKAAPRYTGDDRRLLDGVPDELHRRLRLRNRRIVVFAVTGAIVLAVGAPLLVFAIVAARDGMSFGESLGKHWPMFFMLPFGVYLGMFAGVSAGILDAPSWYLECPFGRKWLELSGAQSPFGAKVVGLLVVLVALAYPWFLYTLSGPPGRP